jgi:hypothetical protein
MRYFSELKREPTEMSYVMYASSPYVVDILRLMNKTLPNRALSNLVQNPGKGVLTYLLENYSERLLDQELQDALCLNSSDEVVDYMSSILYPIPYGNMSRIKNRCQNLLMNKNPSVENIAVDYLNAFLQEIGRTIRYHHEAEFAPIRESLGATWSASLLPRVLKMLEENPEYIVWYFLSLNPSDIAIQILKKNLNNIVIQQFVKNKNKEMISVIEEYITTYDSSLNGGWHNWTVIDELFTNEGVVEIDHTETKRRVTEWVKELLRTGY